MRLLLHDPEYTERLASFLCSLGQHSTVRGPDQVEIEASGTETDRAEVEIYLRVWSVLYPEAGVELMC